MNLLSSLWQQLTTLWRDLRPTFEIDDPGYDGYFVSQPTDKVIDNVPTNGGVWQ